MTAPLTSLQPGDWVEGLQIEQVLSVSAWAAVYRASDPTVGTQFVLKECLPAHCAERAENGQVRVGEGVRKEDFDAAQSAFRSECRLAATLEHPRLARVLRYFEFNGTGFGLMGWHSGQSLARLLQPREAMAAGAVRGLVTGLMEALQYLHGRGIAHLAIEPANIHVTDQGQPLLLDFRLAVLRHAGASAPPPDGPWSAPEMPDGSDNDFACDIYSLAAVGYQCVTGVPPVAARERRDAIRAGRPDPLPGAGAAGSDPGLGGLREAIDFGLCLEPGERPASVTAWKKGLESVDWRRQFAGSEAQTTPAGERREWLTPMLLGGFLAVLLLVSLYLAFSDREDPVLAQDAPVPREPVATAIPAAETERWQAALRADTVLGYRRFLDDFPGSAYLAQAEVQLGILDERSWGELSAEDSRAAYQDYLDLFPDGLHQAEALRRIESIDQAAAKAERERIELEQRELAAWQQALRERSIASLDQYIAEWPAGPHLEEARTLRRQLHDRELESRAWASATRLGNKDAYQAYLDAYPQGEHAAEALISLEHLDLAPGKAFRDCAACPAMIVLPAGEFWQGSGEDDPLAAANERPARLVRIPRPLAVSVHEVTFDQWDACVADGGCTTRPQDNGWGRGDRPVILVSWNDAQQYAGWLSATAGQAYRLPSESEWEYFARAGESGPWLGGSPAALCGFANVAGSETGFRWKMEDCSDGHALGTLPAGSLSANRFGLHDVIGNVAEWTEDCVNLSYLDAPTDGSAWGRGICSSHVTRGGSWLTGLRESRLPARFTLDSGDRNDFTGFRVVRSIEQ